MAHQHICRYCEENFICPADAAECFKRYIVCDDCFRQIELPHIIVVFILAIIAIGMTLVGVKLMK